jgi:plasmid stabilization system protein ParE
MKLFFIKKCWGTYPKKILNFKKEIVQITKTLETMPKMGSQLSSRLALPTNIRYQLAQDYVVLYVISGQKVLILRLLSMKSNWINSMISYKKRTNNQPQS